MTSKYHHVENIKDDCLLVVKVEVLGRVSRTQQNKGHFSTLRFQKTDVHALDIAWLRKLQISDVKTMHFQPNESSLFVGLMTKRI